MKAWMKGAIVGFVFGFICWAYVMITSLHYYQSEKYNIAFYSFFYGVVLVGVFAGILVFTGDKWEKWSGTKRMKGRIFIMGSIWGLYSGFFVSLVERESMLQFNIQILPILPGWFSYMLLL